MELVENNNPCIIHYGNVNGYHIHSHSGFGVILMDLWDHQKKAISAAQQVENLALLHEAGTGKTCTMISILRDHYNRTKRLRRTLILCPLIVTEQWKKEFAKFSKVPQEKIVVLTGSGSFRVKLFNKMKAAHPKGFIVIMNYEAVQIDSLYQLICDWSPEILVLDESHRCKNPSSRRVKKLIPIADQAAHRYIMTGTPVLNTPMDLFSQYRLLDRGESFGRNFFAFRARYFYDANAAWKAKGHYFPNWKVLPKAIEELAEILSETAVQARKKDCLDLPPYVQVDIPITLGSEQQRAYNEMKKLFVAQVKEKVITATLAITQSLRLRQILAGFIQVGEDNPDYFEQNPRLDTCVEKCESLVEEGGKVIIWTDFKATYSMLQKALAAKKIDSTLLTGEQSKAAKDKAVEEFTLGDIPVLIANPSAGGTGVNLIQASSSIDFTQSYSLGDNIQKKARNYRGGSEMHEKITNYRLRVVGTLDDAIIEALDTKEKMAESLWDSEETDSTVANTILKWAENNP